MERYFCPLCGNELEEGQYWYDMDDNAIRVDNCPQCNCEYGDPCVIEVDEDEDE